MNIRKIGLVGLAFLLPASGIMAGKLTGTQQSTRLYTKSDPNAPGGFHASIAASGHPVQQAFAINNGNPELVYQGAVSPDGKDIRFTGLPAAIYDLMLVTPDRFYEGCRLSRDPDTLTDRDRKLIDEAIMKSVPFFDTKKIHRCEGTTGREGKARCVLQEVRTHPVMLQSGVERKDIQVRSLKVTIVQDVGEIGWQLTDTREVLRTEVGPQDPQGLLHHRYVAALGNIRVVDTDKDLGTLELTRESLAPKE